MKQKRSLKLSKFNLILLCLLLLQACSTYDPIRYNEEREYENELHDKTNG